MQRRAIDPARGEHGPREDVRVCGLGVPPDERPGTVRPLVRPVEPDVASPDDPGAELYERGDQAGRLRVVDEDDVPAPHGSPQPLEVLLGDQVVVRALGGPELATVARRPVETVVETLRDREELGVARDHEPVHVDPEPT